MILHEAYETMNMTSDELDKNIQHVIDENIYQHLKKQVVTEIRTR